MIRTLCVALFGLTLVGLTTAARADDKKEVTLKGTITCAKCDLGLEKKCATVIKVSENGKDVIYYFDDAGHKKHHGPICQTPKEGSVTGTTSEKDGKKIITATKVEFNK